MADRMNPNLNNLFQNWQNKKKYDQNPYDVNGDRIINYKDKKKLQDNEKNLLKNDRIFDVNNDGKLNQEDVDLFLRGDINGDGKVSDEELSFVSLYKDDFTTAFNKQKIDFIMDGIAYSGSKKATGIINGQYYKNGVLFTGKTGGKIYVYGNVLSDGDTYKINSNKIAVITSKDGKTVKCCKEDGIIYSTITDSNLSTQPSIKWGDAVEFEGGKTVAIRNGDTAVINANGNVVVTLKDGKTKKVYDKNGNLYSTITNNNTNGKPSIKWGDAVEFEGGKTVAIRNGDTAVINANGNVVVTLKDGKTKKVYDKNGNLYSTITNNNTANQKPAIKWGDAVEFECGKTLAIRNGDTAVINSNGNVVVTSKDGKTTKVYDKNGNLYSTITNNNTNGKPSIKWGDAVEFEGGKTLAIRNGDTAVINSNGNVVVTSKDGKTTKVYDKNGNLYATITNNNTANQKPAIKWGDAVEFEGGKTLAIRNGDTAVINSNGNVVVTSKDGKTVKKYDKNGNIAKTDEEYLDFLTSKGYDIQYLDIPDIEIYGDKDPVTFTREVRTIKVPDSLTANIKSDIEILMKADEIANTAKQNALAQGKSEDEAQRIYESTYNREVLNAYVPQKTSMAEALESTSVGDVVEINDKLYVHDGNQMVELKMSKEKYIELLPPVERYNTLQGSIGDCFFVASTLYACMNNPTTYAKMLQMISVDNSGNLTITFEGELSPYPVTFEGGNLFVCSESSNDNISPGVRGCDFAKFFEQAYAVASFSKMMTETGRHIELDNLYDSIRNGGSPVLAMAHIFNVKRNNIDNEKKFLIDYREIKNISEDDFSKIKRYKYLASMGVFIEELAIEYDNLLKELKKDFPSVISSSVGLYKEFFQLDFEYDKFAEMIKEYNYQMISSLATEVNSQKAIVLCCSRPDIDIDDETKSKYRWANPHQYAIEHIDTQNKTVMVVNPWTCGISMEIPYDDFIKYFLIDATLDINTIN